MLKKNHIWPPNEGSGISENSELNTEPIAIIPDNQHFGSKFGTNVFSPWFTYLWRMCVGENVRWSYEYMIDRL